MFYSQYVLTKKSVLGRVWLAAHWERKLTKQQILASNLPESVKFIAQPDAPLALRLSGHLLLGVARIFAQKTNYLFSDCQQALVKIKLAHQSQAKRGSGLGGDQDIDLHEGPGGGGGLGGPGGSDLSRITLPEVGPHDGDFRFDLQAQAAGGSAAGSLAGGGAGVTGMGLNLADLALPDEDLLELHLGGATVARKELLDVEGGAGLAGDDSLGAFGSPGGGLGGLGDFDIGFGAGDDDMPDEFVPIGMSQQPDDSGDEVMRGNDTAGLTSDPSIDVARGDGSVLGLGFEDDFGVGGGFEDEFSLGGAGLDPLEGADGISGIGTPMKDGMPSLNDDGTPAGPGELREVSVHAGSEPPSPDDAGHISYGAWQEAAAPAEAAEPEGARGAAPSRTRKRKAVKVDETLEISSADYRKMLNDDSGTLKDIVPAPASKRAMLAKAADDKGPKYALTRVHGLEHLPPALLQLFTRNMVVSAGDAAAVAAAEAAAADGADLDGKGDMFNDDDFGVGAGFDDSFGNGSFTLGGFEEDYDVGPGGTSFEQQEEVRFGPGTTLADEQDLEARGDDEEELDEDEQARLEKERTTTDAQGVSKRTQKMHNFLRGLMEEAEGQLKPKKGSKKPAAEPELSFLNMVDDSQRNVVVSTFLELLVLAGKERVRLHQDEAYADVVISKGDRFDGDLVTEQSLKSRAKRG